MKSNLLLFTVTCLCLLAISAKAQQMREMPIELAPMDMASPTQEKLRKQLVNTLSQQIGPASQRASLRGVSRSMWNDQGMDQMAFSVLYDVHAAFGISEEQVQQINNRVGAAINQMPTPRAGTVEFAMLNFMVETGISDETGTILDGWQPDAETMARMETYVLDHIEEHSKGLASAMNNATTDGFNEFLTAEQLQRINESHLANLGEFPIFSPSVFEILDLTDAQREQMEQIKRELEPEYLTTLDSWMDGFIALQERVSEEYNKEHNSLFQAWQEERQSELYTSFLREWDAEQELAPGEVITGYVGKDGEPMLYVADQATLEEIIRSSEMLPLPPPIDTEDIRKRLLAENPEFRRVSEEIRSKGRAFATEFKIKMFDVLTDEQWIRLQNLIDNPPEHALAFRMKLRELTGINEEGNDGEDEASAGTAKPDVWQPGPGAWRPGEGIPGTYRIERNERIQRFPRGADL